MKKHLAVMGVAVRGSILKLLAVVVCVAAAQTLAFRAALQEAISAAYAGEIISLYDAVERSHMDIFAHIGFLALCVCLSLAGSDLAGSRPSLLLKRLRVPERLLTLEWAACNLGFILIYWAFQVAMALLLGTWYVQTMAPGHANGQTLFMAFYCGDYLHSLLPLADSSRLACNTVTALCMAFSLACASYKQRRGKKPFAALLLCVFCAAMFPEKMGSVDHDLIVMLGAALLTIPSAITLWGGMSDGESD